MLSLRRDDVTTTRTVVRITNFNPRLREGGDDIYHAPSCCKKISIHASAKEATVGDARCSILRCNFNPRLREGGDYPSSFFNGFYINFNPRLREGGDHGCRTKEEVESIISIHASAKEATALGTIDDTPYTDFNPRLREGGDW